MALVRIEVDRSLRNIHVLDEGGETVVDVAYNWVFKVMCGSCSGDGMTMKRWSRDVCGECNASGVMHSRVYDCTIDKMVAFDPVIDDLPDWVKNTAVSTRR